MTSKKTRRPWQEGARHSGKNTGSSYWTTQSHGEVRLRQDENSFTEKAPLTIHDMIMGTAIKYANYIALGSKYKDNWHLLTYIEYYEECRRAAKAFLKVQRAPARYSNRPPTSSHAPPTRASPSPSCACARL
ncbi:long-chain-fatty-acid--CoA ligase ACSBG2-like [Nycticebus coucang]|uniref:long-chain-fatty-acid--CoA ligase ACSBG2-like n=1 Tax=Nycticebus coucang TaxID=9470 RepID=UPI00234C2141|nr:long-chain-fatty-acid--CoA ligase ACSBG2-like [Nycticebus coucang]